MFEKEIKFITDFSLNKIKKLGAFFTFEQLQSLDLHPAILKYINSELEYLIFQDRKKLLQNSAFDYSGQQIQKHFDVINEEIKKNKSISFEDAKSLIMQAVSFTANYVVRPKWSLTKFIYNQDQLKSIDEIKLSLNYLYYYDYIKNVLLTYIEKKKSVNLSLIDFEVVLNKINKELFNAHARQLIDNALMSMSDFFNIGGNGEKISPLHVELFLKEKDQIDYLFRIRRSLPVDTRQQFEINEVKKILYSPVEISKSEIELFDKEIEKEKVKTQSEQIVPDEENKQTEEIPAKEEPEVKPDTESLPGEIDETSTDEAEEEPIEIPLKREKPDEIEVGEDDISDEEYFSMADVESEENTEDTGNVDEEEPEDNSDPDAKIEIEEEEITGEDFLEELSADDELLDAFDSQLKALEEESGIFIKEDDFEEEKNESEEEQTPEENEENVPDLFGDENDLIVSETEEDEQETEQDDRAADEPKPEIPFREKDIFSFLSDKDIEKIVAGVFNDDREDFANTMEKISECLNYDEATEILKSVFFSYRVNPYTRDAVTLTNSVSNYFNQA